MATKSGPGLGHSTQAQTRGGGGRDERVSVSWTRIEPLLSSQSLAAAAHGFPYLIHDKCLRLEGGWRGNLLFSSLHHQRRQSAKAPNPSRPKCPARASVSPPSTAAASRQHSTRATARRCARPMLRRSRPSWPSSARCCSSLPRRTPRISGRTRRSAPSSPACAPPSASTHSRAAAPLRRPSGPSCWAAPSTTSTLSSPCASSRSAARRAARTAA